MNGDCQLSMNHSALVIMSLIKKESIFINERQSACAALTYFTKVENDRAEASFAVTHMSRHGSLVIANIAPQTGRTLFTTSFIFSKGITV